MGSLCTRVLASETAERESLDVSSPMCATLKRLLNGLDLGGHVPAA